MRIRVLGCSGGIYRSAATTSFLIDNDILIDAGTGVGELPLEAMRQIRHIFITHAHLDHIAAIPLLADTLFEHLVSDPVVVHAQQDTLEQLRRHIFNGQIWPDFTALPQPASPVLRLAAMRAGDSVEVAGRSIEMIPVNHTVPAVAYRIEAGGRSWAFSGDTTSSDSLWAALNRHRSLDLLFIESTFADRDIELARLTRHLCPQLLATDLRKLTHRPTVGISHLKPGEEALIMEECQAALPGWALKRLRSGDVFELDGDGDAAGTGG